MNIAISNILTTIGLITMYDYIINNNMWWEAAVGLAIYICGMFFGLMSEDKLENKIKTLEKKIKEELKNGN